jgi:hypothetical protein
MAAAVLGEPRNGGQRVVVEHPIFVWAALRCPTEKLLRAAVAVQPRLQMVEMVERLMVWMLCGLPLME